MAGDDKQKLIDAFDKLDIIMSAQAKHAASIAHAKRALYLAYIDEGFAPEQALELCKSLGAT
jgi:hypothetical protein